MEDVKCLPSNNILIMMKEKNTKMFRIKQILSIEKTLMKRLKKNRNIKKVKLSQ